MEDFYECDYGEFGGFDNRQFRVGQRVCIRNSDGTDSFGLFEGMAPTHVYGQYDAMEPGLDDELNGYMVSGRGVRFQDVGKLRVKRTSATSTRKVAESAGLPQELEGVIKSYGGKKKSRRRRNRRRKTRRGGR